MERPVGGTAEKVMHLLRSARSVRRYAPRPVPQGAILQVLDVARWTGSGKNQQPWRFVVVRDAGTRERLARLGPYTLHVADAPVVVAIVMGGDPFASDFDEGRVAHSIVLAATALSLGSCVVFLEPLANRDVARTLLQVPDSHRLRTLVTLGYADAGADRFESGAGPRRTQVLGMIGRRPLGDLVSYETFGASFGARG